MVKTLTGSDCPRLFFDSFLNKEKKLNFTAEASAVEQFTLDKIYSKMTSEKSRNLKKIFKFDENKKISLPYLRNGSGTWKATKILGASTFGIVFEYVLDTNINKKVAIKFFNASKKPDPEIDLVHFLKKNYPDLDCQLVSYEAIELECHNCFTNSKVTAIAMTAGQMNLSQYFKLLKKPTDPKFVEYFTKSGGKWQLLASVFAMVTCLCKKQLYYLDLKLNNFVLMLDPNIGVEKTKFFRVLLADLGSICTSQNSAPISYVPPEQLHKKNDSCYESEMTWIFGIVSMVIVFWDHLEENNRFFWSLCCKKNSKHAFESEKKMLEYTYEKAFKLMQIKNYGQDHPYSKFLYECLKPVNQRRSLLDSQMQMLFARICQKYNLHVDEKSPMVVDIKQMPENQKPAPTNNLKNDLFFFQSPKKELNRKGIQTQNFVAKQHIQPSQNKATGYSKPKIKKKKGSNAALFFVIGGGAVLALSIFLKKK